MDTDTGSRLMAGVLVAAAILALLLFARGAPERGRTAPSPSAVAVERLL